MVHAFTNGRWSFPCTSLSIKRTPNCGILSLAAPQRATGNMQRGLHNALPQRGGRNMEHAQGIYPKRAPQRRNVGLGSSHRWEGTLAQLPFGILNCVHKGMTGTYRDKCRTVLCCTCYYAIPPPQCVSPSANRSRNVRCRNGNAQCGRNVLYGAAKFLDC